MVKISDDVCVEFDMILGITEGIIYLKDGSEIEYEEVVDPNEEKRYR